jgi:phage protein D
MINLANLTTSQLHRIIAIKEQIEALQGQIDSIAGGGGEIPSPSSVEPTKKHRRSAAVRARMAAAQQARWAEVKGETATPKAAKKKDRRSSPAVRAKLAAAARARWARVRAEGKTTL